MPIHPFSSIKGEMKSFMVESAAISGNLLGDPPRREVLVYLPPGCDDGPVPLMVYLAGFTGSGLGRAGWKAYQESLPQRLDRLISENRMGPVALALPDCFTSLGGNQYINSIAMGNWSDFLCEEMVPLLERELNLMKRPSARAVLGKSSGGYGAIMQAMLNGNRWGAVACHSGDMGFDRLFLGDLPKALMQLEKYGGVMEFIQHTRDSQTMAGGDLHILMVLAMAATYDPDPDSPMGIRLPVKEGTCELIPERWQAWLEKDPCTLINDDGVKENLKSLKGLFIDCGSRDQYNIQFGTRQLAAAMQKYSIPHVHEEFDDDHSGIDYRLDSSLPFLYSCIVD